MWGVCGDQQLEQTRWEVVIPMLSHVIFLFMLETLSLIKMYVKLNTNNYIIQVVLVYLFQDQYHSQ